MELYLTNMGFYLNQFKSCSRIDIKSLKSLELNICY